MFDDQDGREWGNVSSGTGLPGLSRTKGCCVLCDVHAFISKMVHFEHVMSHVEVSVQG